MFPALWKHREKYYRHHYDRYLNTQLVDASILRDPAAMSTSMP